MNYQTNQKLKKDKIMTTEQKLNYLKKLLVKAGCPISLRMPYAIQLLNYCKKQNKCVTELELTNMEA